MSQEKAALLMFKGVLSDLPPDDKEKVDVAFKEIQDFVSARGEHGMLALQWLMLEMAAEA